MARATAVLYGVPAFDGRVVPAGFASRALRLILKNALFATAAVATVAVAGIGVTCGAAWMVNRSMASNPHIQASAPIGPASLALVQPGQGLAQVIQPSFKEKWAQTGSLMSLTPQVVSVPEQKVRRNVAAVSNPAIAPRTNTVIQTAKVIEPTPIKPVVHVAVTPLPHPYPDELKQLRTAQAEEAKAQAIKAAELKQAEELSKAKAARLAALPPPVTKPVYSANDRYTALYDITGHTVYMPNGDKLEAHSGLGDKFDNPRYTKVRMRGPTPPNVYDLTERESLFHGVRAIRLNPVDEGRMYGRDGMLAHTYMLGPRGNSNGCVSFKDYRKFLNAFLNGEVKRMVVVADLGKTPWRQAVAEHTHVRRYASNN